MITFAQMKRNLSILIPTYNDVCTVLVKSLQQQAEALGLEDYEIVVADDGSTDDSVLAQNRHINQIPHCRLIERSENNGRAAIRNFLALQSRYEWLLFIDSDMVVCRQDFLRRYIETSADVVDGGVKIGDSIAGNLRSLYEKAAESAHTPEQRQQYPYQDFHTANFLISRDIMLQHPFDLRFRYYGYEDVLFGKVLQQHGIDILHIDNPLSFEIYESNDAFVSKTEEGLRTLYRFQNELQGYVRILAHCRRLSVFKPIILLWHRLFGSIERHNLTGSHPSLTIFSLYRLGYFLSLSD